ncbi:hypothetical protein Q767_06315 [Flavobacterium enshiense DK69]|uniref:Uncharacterized protein n=1 Tax=Flavobacterium enshiense DK69 TaxID=1107311 RepID=A0A0A2N7S6_9FLAO|nr:hypothetical protein Q767_06315 [Flavobacterium enshiense DK69]
MLNVASVETTLSLASYHLNVDGKKLGVLDAVNVEVPEPQIEAGLAVAVTTGYPPLVTKLLKLLSAKEPLQLATLMRPTQIPLEALQEEAVTFPPF